MPPHAISHPFISRPRWLRRAGREKILRMNDGRVSESKPLWPWLVAGIVGALVVSQVIRLSQPSDSRPREDQPLERASPRQIPPHQLADEVYLRFLQDEAARSPAERMRRAVDGIARKHSLSPDAVRAALNSFAAAVGANAYRNAHEAAVAAAIRGRFDSLPARNAPTDPLGGPLHQINVLTATKDWARAESAIADLHRRTHRESDAEGYARVRAAEFFLRYSQERLDEAFTIAREVRTIRERVLPPDSPGIARALDNVAVCLSRRGRDDEAVPLYRRSLAIYEKAYGLDDVEVADTASELAASLSDLHQLDESETQALRAIAIFERAGADHAIRLALTYDRLGEIWLLGKRNADAETALRQAVAIYDRRPGDVRAKDHSDAVHRLGLSIARQDRRRQALPYLKRSTEIAAKWFADDDPLYAVLFHNMAVWADGAGDDPLTVEGYKRALQILAKNQRRTKHEPAQMRQTREFYAAYLQRAGLSEADIQRKLAEAMR